MGRKTHEQEARIENPKVDTLRLVRAAIPLRELAADKLRDAILSGVFAPGTRLVESALAERMGVSRASIRETLSLLTVEKLVVLAPNKGFSVAAITWPEAQEIYHVRKLLEGEVAFLFAQRCQKDELAHMRRALRNFERAVERADILKLVRSTEEFYKIMLDGCGNKTLTEVFRGLIARINVLRVRSMSRAGRARHSLAEMSAVLDACERGDAREARTASCIHVEAAALAAMENFKELTQSPS